MPAPCAAGAPSAVGAACPGWTHTTALPHLAQAETPLLPPGILPARSHLREYARPGTAVPVVQGMSLAVMETQLLSCADTMALTC